MSLKRTYGKLATVILLCFISMTAGYVYGEVEQSDVLSERDALSPSAPGRELLLLEDIPIVVVTPAKVEQTIMESPSTITVLTKEDIRRYGITGLSDILRNIPGVDVMSVSPTDRNISMRGLDQLSAGRILSLLNNQPVYMEFYGMTTWESLPILIDEIERIEVIRGPGSALYGANAFDGIVNIITDSASAPASTRMTANVNHSGKLGGSVIHSGDEGNLDYRASLGWDSISGWGDEDADDGENKTFNGLVQYNIDNKSNIHLSAGTNERRGDLLILSEIDPAEYDGAESYLKLNYTRPDLKYNSSWRRLVSDVDLFGLAEYWFESHILDNELQYSFRLAKKNSVTLGANYQLKYAKSEIIGGSHTQNLFAVYIQDQFRIYDALEATAGLRYDKHPITGDSLSPRGSIVYSPTKGHALRASAGRAFRNPPFLYSYVSMDYSARVPIIPAPIIIEVSGNQDIPPEWITSLELGYRGIFGARIKGDVSAFYNKLNDLIDYGYAETYSENALFPGSPGGTIPSVVSTVKKPDAKAWGGEVALDLSITPWLSLYGNYSYQNVTNSKTGERIKSSPRHKLNPGLCLKPGRRLLISLFANYVDTTIWDGVELDPYTMLNSAASYRAEKMEIMLSIYNLLNDGHLEHPKGDEIGRSIVLSVMYRIY